MNKKDGTQPTELPVSRLGRFDNYKQHGEAKHKDGKSLLRPELVCEDQRELPEMGRDGLPNAPALISNLPRGGCKPLARLVQLMCSGWGCSGMAKDKPGKFNPQ